MAIRWTCSECGLPIMNKDDEAGAVSTCPRCRHEELVPEGSSSEEASGTERNRAGSSTSGVESAMVNLGMLGLCVLAITLILGVFWLLNFTFSAPDQMIEDGIGTFGSQHLPKK